MPLKRTITTLLQKRIGQNKVLLLFGTRRTGKTWLLKQLKAEINIKPLHFNGEDEDVQVMLSKRTIANYHRIIGKSKLLIIDEAQAIPDIGKILKLMIDETEDLTIIATGSSAFDLSNKAGDPLTGRSYTYHLYPIAQMELQDNESPLKTKQELDERLIYGSYPEMFNLETLEEKAIYLKELVNAYLLKDILMYEDIKNSSKVKDLLKLLAYQVGSEVSTNELSRQLGISKNTVDRYLDLLEKVDVIFKLSGYSNNLRKEVTKSSKWYFFDNGIRNTLINDMRLPHERQDMGALWENYCLYERMKTNAYKQSKREYYFWRTYDQQEIDFIEIEGKKMQAFEFKWGSGKMKVPVFFAKNYPDVPFEIINPESYLEFILVE
jgi:predicted AAA+ superfamily ATPase